MTPEMERAEAHISDFDIYLVNVDVPTFGQIHVELYNSKNEILTSIIQESDLYIMGSHVKNKLHSGQPMHHP